VGANLRQRRRVPANAAPERVVGLSRFRVCADLAFRVVHPVDLGRLKAVFSKSKLTV